MSSHSNRTSRDARRLCPDCNGKVVRADSVLIPGRPPTVEHQPGCPVERAAQLAFADDLRWLARRPDVPFRVRRLGGHEVADMATALGRRAGRSDRDRWRVVVHRYGRHGLARTFLRGGERIAVVLTHPDAAGAGEVR